MYITQMHVFRADYLALPMNILFHEEEYFSLSQNSIIVYILCRVEYSLALAFLHSLWHVYFCCPSSAHVCEVILEKLYRCSL